MQRECAKRWRQRKRDENIENVPKNNISSRNVNSSGWILFRLLSVGTRIIGAMVWFVFCDLKSFNQMELVFQTFSTHCVLILRGKHLRAQTALCYLFIAYNRFRMYQCNSSRLNPFIQTEHSNIDQLTIQIIYKFRFVRLSIGYDERHVISKLRRNLWPAINWCLDIYDWFVMLSIFICRWTITGVDVTANAHTRIELFFVVVVMEPMAV